MIFDSHTQVEKHVHRCAAQLLGLSSVHSVGMTTLNDRPAALIAMRRFGWLDRRRAKSILRGCPADFVVVGDSMALAKSASGPKRR